MTPYYTESHKHLIAIDCIIFGFDEGELKILLHRRKFEPEKGKWSLMGGFLQPDEGIDNAARRILQGCSGLSNLFMEQLLTFGEIDRDPGERVVSVAYFALIRIEDYNKELNLETTAQWWPISKKPVLIFDHDEMVERALERLQIRSKNRPIGFELLPRKFTVPQLQSLYEAINRRMLDKRNFRKKILSMNLIRKLDEKEKKTSKKGAFLYRFDKRRYKRLVEKGFHFEL
ncbi:MAG TPA: NUDIX domain-containing protein [Bacteroidales bacterium]|nr:NUDIX domain-containing protein [Bacteroidales bacterium]